MTKFADEFHALDSLKVAAQLNRRLEQENRHLDVLVQINTSGEASKYGLAPAEAHDFVQNLADYPHLNV